MDDILYSLIKSFQINNNNNDLLVLIEKFNPLIRKYSRKLNYDGAESDLIIEFIEILKKIPLDKPNLKKDTYILSYLKVSIKNKFIKLNKYNTEILNKELELNTDIIGIYANNSIDNNLILKHALSQLPNNQKKIILYKFFEEKSDIEIAKELKISRQAVNKSKNLALKNLRKSLLGNLNLYF